MAFTTAALDGTVLPISLGDKIPLDGQDLIVTGIGSYANGMRRRQPLISPRPLQIHRFDHLDPDTGAIVYQDPVTVPIQVKEAKDQRSQLMTEKRGPDSPDTFRQAYLAEANWPAAGYPLIQIVLQDEAQGLMFPGLYTVQRIPPPSITQAAKPNQGIAAKTLPALPVALKCLRVELREQIQTVDNQLIKRGDACVVVEKTGLPYETLLLPNQYFDITLPGGTVLRYQLPGKEGIESLQTHHWELYLGRLRP